MGPWQWGLLFSGQQEKMAEQPLCHMPEILALGRWRQEGQEFTSIELEISRGTERREWHMIEF